jgi:hypothetical protein
VSCNARPRCSRHAEDAYRQPSYGACDAIAVGIERRPRRGADVGGRVHFHAVDDRREIVALQIEGADRLGQRPHPRRRRFCEQRIDVRPPLA